MHSVHAGCYHLGAPWSLAGELWRSRWQTAAGGLYAPRRTTPRLSRTTSQCCCLGCSVWAACWTSSRWCRFCLGRIQSAAGGGKKNFQHFELNVQATWNIVCANNNNLPQAPSHQMPSAGAGGWPRWSPSAEPRTGPRCLAGSASWRRA